MIDKWIWRYHEVPYDKPMSAFTTFGSMVQKGKFSAAATVDPVGTRLGCSIIPFNIVVYIYG